MATTPLPTVQQIQIPQLAAIRQFHQPTYYAVKKMQDSYNQLVTLVLQLQADQNST